MSEKIYNRTRSESASSIECSATSGFDSEKKTSKWDYIGRIFLVLFILIEAYRHLPEFSGGCSHTDANDLAGANEYNVDPSASSPLPMEVSRIVSGAYKTFANEVKEEEDYIILPTKTAEYNGKFDRRADKKTTKTTDNPKSSETTAASKPTKFYNQAGVRFVFVLAAFVILNMFAIVIHHIYQKLSGSQRRYRNVDQNISPF
ncbi:hypothetical protein CLIB1423_12S04148 [[Candida] railenensis]|uniref:Uncharacterized protein n=1 Tax=[Candida] railenensis TaxID=45579 RepID=A0A9P0QSA7_9ASCO|nr:hypothetical protein CLIB1423_12S04148 [[Candida] railenensis]